MSTHPSAVPLADPTTHPAPAPLPGTGAPADRSTAVLWRDRTFRRFWSGQAVSVVGAQITLFTIPVFAVTRLHADASDVALLRVLETLPFVVLALPVGVWLDRHAPRPAMLAANFGRAGLVTVVAVAGLLGVLHIGALAAAVLLVGAATVVFDIAYLSYLPRLVSAARLVDANSKLSLSESAAQVGGPGLSGLLIQTLTAPAALLINGLGYAVSAIFLHRLRRHDAASITAARSADPHGSGDDRVVRPAAAGPRTRRLAIALRDVVEGLRFVATQRYLRVICLEAFAYNLFSQFGAALVVVFALEDLHLSAAALGLYISLGSAGAVLGSVLAPRTVRLVGFGPAFTIGTAMACAAPVLVPLTADVPHLAGAIITASYFLSGIGLTLSNIGSITLRQSVAPPHLLARVNSVTRLISYSALPLGSAAAGAIAAATTVRASLFVASAGFALPMLILLLSPVPRLRESFQAAPAGAGPDDQHRAG